MRLKKYQGMLILIKGIVGFLILTGLWFLVHLGNSPSIYFNPDWKQDGWNIFVPLFVSLSYVLGSWIILLAGKWTDQKSYFIYKTFIRFQKNMEWILIGIGLAIVLWNLIGNVFLVLHLLLIVQILVSIYWITRLIWYVWVHSLFSRIKLWLFIFLAGWYCFSLSNVMFIKTLSTSSDEPYYLLVCESLLRDADLDLKNNLDSKHYKDFYWEKDELYSLQNIVPVDGKLYTSAYSGLFVWLLLPAYALLGRLGAVLVLTAFASILSLQILYLSRYLVADAKINIWPCLLMSWTLPWARFAGQIFPEIIACNLACFLLIMLLNLEKSKYNHILFCLGIGLLVLLRFRYLPLAIIFLFLYPFYFKKSSSKWTWFIILSVSIALGFGIAPILFKNMLALQRFGSLDQVVDIIKGFSQSNFYYSLAVLFDQEHGIFIYAPFFIFTLWGLIYFYKQHTKLVLSLMGIMFAYSFILVRKGGYEWYGSYILCSRYFLCIWALLWPFLILGMIKLFEKKYIAVVSATVLWSCLLWILFQIQPLWAFHNFKGAFNLFKWIDQNFQINIYRFFASFSEKGKWGTLIWFSVLFFIIGFLITSRTKLKDITLHRIILLGAQRLGLFFVFLITLAFIIPESYGEAELMNNGIGQDYYRRFDANRYSSSGILYKRPGKLHGRVFLSNKITNLFARIGGYVEERSIHEKPSLNIYIDGKILNTFDLKSEIGQWHYGKIQSPISVERGWHDMEFECVNCQFKDQSNNNRLIVLDRWWVE